MRHPRRWLMALTVLAVALTLAAVAMAGAIPPKCIDDPLAPGCPPTTTSPTTTTTAAPADGLDCAGLFEQPEWEWGDGSPEDGYLSMTADVDADCNDIPHELDGSTFTFDFAVTPTDGLIKTFFVLGIANSRPGDWCGGHWTYSDESGNVLISGFGNAIRPAEVGHGYSAQLVLDEVLDGTNCTGTDGVVHLLDADPDWVVTLQRSGGKPLKGTEDITVSWGVTPPGE